MTNKTKGFVSGGLMTWLFLVSPAFAANTNTNIWTIDSAQSSVTFKVKHMSWETISGRFNKVAGTVNYDGKNLRDSAVDAAIETQSIDTNQTKRDDHLRSKHFFDVAEFPNITFKSAKIVPEDGGAFKIKGLISMHGYAREIELDAQPLQEMVSLDGEKRLVASASTQLNRKDFGISMGFLDKGGALIGDTVQITLNIELVNSASSAAPSTPFRRFGHDRKLFNYRVALACSDVTK
jgi:polyisoprenoid-binding protein YceI